MKMVSWLRKWVKGKEETGDLPTNPEARSFNSYNAKQQCHCGKKVEPVNSVHVCACQTLCHYHCVFQELRVLTAGTKKTVICPTCNSRLKLIYTVRETQKIEFRPKYVMLLLLGMLIFATFLGLLVYTAMELQNTINPVEMVDAFSIIIAIIGIGMGCLIGYYSVRGIIYMRQTMLESITPVQKVITAFEVTFSESSNSVSWVLKNDQRRIEVEQILDRVVI